MRGKWTEGPWAVVEPADDFDNITICAFDGDPKDGIMADVVAEITSIEDRADAYLIAAVKPLYEALEKLDAHIDFSSLLEPGDWGVEDPASLNAAFAEALAALSQALPPKGEEL